ncbi:MAG: hypothetical protein V4663_02360 [Bacteroidota bacterium]
MSIEHFYIDTELNDDSAYKEAMKFACDLADKNPEIQRVVLLAATKNNVDWLGRAFDSSTVKELFKGMRFKDCKPLFKIETVKTYKQSFKKQDVVISMAIDDEYVLPLDDMYSTIAVIAIPWQKSGIKQYMETWNPVDIRSGQQFSSEGAEPSCIVKVALKELHESINHSTGIVNPHDNRKAKTTVLALHKYEVELDGDLIKGYLIRELKWDTKHAEDLAKLIRTLNSGKSFQGGVRTGLQHHYKSWKEQCK